MPRVVLSDPESDAESDESENESQSQSQSQSDEEEIVYESEEEDLDKLERELAKREPPRRAHKRKRRHKDYSSDESRDTDDDDDDDDDDDGGGRGRGGRNDNKYTPWETLRQEYLDDERDSEPAGLTEHPEVHAPGWRKGGPAWTQAQKDELWASVCATAAKPGFRRKWGMVATERQVGGNTVRIVHRVHYGRKFRDLFKPRKTGSYLEAFIPTMVELFKQQPWQPLFDKQDVKDRTIPMPMFEDFKAAYHFDNRGRDPMDLSHIVADHGWDEYGDEGAEYHGPMWCLCTECTDKGLRNVTIMRHTLSGILIAVGGNCAAHMVGESRLNEMIDFELNGRSDYDAVAEILGW
jgi:hypothetical protein